MSLSRIYQGRVARLKLLEGKAIDAEPVSDDRMTEILAEHHAEFQRAVNYHQFQLLRLSTDEESPLGKIRKRMIEADVAARRLKAKDYKDDAEKRRLQDLATHDVWNDFRRDGRKRPGMARSVGKALGLSGDVPLSEAFGQSDEAFNDPSVSAELYNTAVKALITDLGGDGAIQQKGREYLPRFCDPGFSGSFPRSGAALTKKRIQAELPGRLQDPETAKDPEGLRDELEFEHFANVHLEGKPLDRNRCIELFEEAVELLTKESGLPADEGTRLLGKTSNLPEDFELPAYRGASVKKVLRNRFFAFLVFKHLEASPLTFRVFRDTYPEPRPAKTRVAIKKTDADDLLRFEDDPVKLARGKKQIVYPGFTALSGWCAGKPATMSWKEFDIAAFKEALKAFNQVKGRTEEREAKREQCQSKIRYMEQGGKIPQSRAGEDDELGELVTFAGDDRFQRFQELLAQLKTQESKDAEEYSAEDPRGLRFRAIRGRKELFVEWNKTLRKLSAPKFDEDGHETNLLKILNEHQAEHRDDMGWARLFRSFIRQELWDFWREPSAEVAARRRDANHSNDFLGDYVSWSDLVIDAERLAEPIRFSPADAEKSRRLFMFSDACNFTPKGEFRHVPGELAVIVPVAVREGGLFTKRRVRLDYNAPRLLRDGLRSGAGDESLARSLWNQPMMVTFGVAETDATQDISKAAVALMPDRSRYGQLRFLLNFPLTLSEEGVVAKVAEKRGQSLDWARQFVSYGKGDDVQHFYLRWPGFDKAPAKEEPWHESSRSFRVLAVDLGIRFAAAGARVKAYAGGDREKERDRKIGVIGNDTWHAQVERLITFRLPGEDRCRPDGWKEKEDGRRASTEEVEAAEELVFSLDQHPRHLGLEQTSYRVGELGGKLVVAMRRAISHLRALNRWSRMADRWDDAQKEIGARRDREQKQARQKSEAGETPAIAEWSRILDGLTDAAACQTRAEELKPKIKTAVEQAANLLVPIRHGHWEWHRSAEASEGRPASFELRQIAKAIGEAANKNRDQGGLSPARIERITDFRKILQSLNRLFGLRPGEKPPSGREMRSQPLPDPCPALSAKLEAMKEQRVNQTAHMILAEALGLELRAPATERAERKRRDLHGEYVSKRPPVDFIVIEDLARYRTTQGRTRQENSRLMQWCHRQISAKLKMLCEAYGLVVVETPAAYSSRFCSLTGQPGFRAQELTRDAFFREYYWKQAVGRAEKNPDAASARAVLAIKKTFEDLPEGSKKTLLLPRQGGSVFVPSGSGNRQNADLNAAVNLAFRAIAAPNQFDIHTRVRSEWKSGSYQTRETRNRFGPKPIQISVSNLKMKEDDSAPDSLESKPNFFFVAGPIDPGFDIAELDFLEKPELPCHSGRSLWKRVNDTAWERAAELNET